MEAVVKAAFELRWDGDFNARYPNGYWYARTADGSWDAAGDTPLNALANLVTVLYEALRDETAGT